MYADPHLWPTMHVILFKLNWNLINSYYKTEFSGRLLVPFLAGAVKRLKYVLTLAICWRSGISSTCVRNFRLLTRSTVLHSWKKNRFSHILERNPRPSIETRVRTSQSCTHRNNRNFLTTSVRKCKIFQKYYSRQFNPLLQHI